jgi:hypothetical protein
LTAPVQAIEPGTDRAERTVLDLRTRLLRPTLAELWTYLAVALPVLAALLAPLPTVDLAYQLRAGGEILDRGAIPSVDTWTFTIAGAHWLDQQWGAQVVLAIVFRIAGWTGLALLRALLVGLVFGLVLAAIRERSPGISSRVAALLAITALIVAAPALALRPQLFAIVLFAMAVLVLALIRSGRQPGLVWLLPVLSAAWVNVHGSFPLLLVLVGLATLEDVLAGRGLDRRLLAAGGIMAVATLVNPFGPGVWAYVVGLATSPVIGARVSEWQPPSPTDPSGAVFFASVLAVAAIVAWRLRSGVGRGLPVTSALPTLVVFALLALTTGRGLAWWALAAPITVAGLLPPATANPARVARRSPVNAAIGTAIGLVALAALPVWRPLGPVGAPLGALAEAPQGIASELRTLPDGARVWNPQLWGSWLELAVPGVRVATDSRIELYTSGDWDDAQLVALARPGWDDVLARYDVDAVVVRHDSDILLEEALRASRRWDNPYVDPDGSIWVPRPSPVGG